MPAGVVLDHPTDRRLRQELRKLSAALDKLGHKYRRQGLQLQAGAAREQYWKSVAAARQAGAEQVRLVCRGAPCILPSQQDLPPAMSTADRRRAGGQLMLGWHLPCTVLYACSVPNMSCLKSGNR